MTLKQYAVTGTDGQAATTANTGATSQVAAGSSTITIQSSNPYKSGLLALKYTGDGTNAAYQNWQFAADATAGADSIAFEVPSAPPSTDLAFANIYDAANTRTVQLLYRANGAVVCADFSGTYHTLLAGPLTPGTWYRFETVISQTGSSTATWHVTTYNQADAAVSGATFTASGNGNTGTNGNLHLLRTGVTTAQAYSLRLAAIQWDDGRTTEIGPMSVAIGNPTVVLTPHGPAYYIDAASASSVGSGSTGSMSYTAALKSGPNNTMWEPVDGQFIILMDNTTDATWTVTGTDSGTGRTASTDVVVPHVPSGTTTVATSLTETVQLASGVWS